MKSKVPKPRNRHAINPLMRKGGIHHKPAKAQRNKDKALLRKELSVRDIGSFFLSFAFICLTFRNSLR